MGDTDTREANRAVSQVHGAKQITPPPPQTQSTASDPSSFLQDTPSFHLKSIPIGNTQVANSARRQNPGPVSQSSTRLLDVSSSTPYTPNSAEIDILAQRLKERRGGQTNTVRNSESATSGTKAGSTDGLQAIGGLEASKPPATEIPSENEIPSATEIPSETELGGAAATLQLAVQNGNGLQETTLLLPRETAIAQTNVSELKSLFEALEIHAATKQAELTKTQNKYTLIKDEFAELQKQRRIVCEELKFSPEDCKVFGEKSAQRYRDLKAELDAAESKLAQLDRDKTQLQSQIETLTEKLKNETTALQVQIDKKHEVVASTTESLKQVQEGLTAKTKELESAKTQQAELTSQLDNLRRQNETLEATRASLQETNSLNVAAIDLLNTAKSSLEARIRELEGDLQSANALNGASEVQIAEQEEKIANLTQDLAAKKTDLEIAQKTVAEQLEQISELQRGNSMLNERVVALESAIHQVKEDNAALKSELGQVYALAAQIHALVQSQTDYEKTLEDILDSIYQLVTNTNTNT